MAAKVNPKNYGYLKGGAIRQGKTLRQWAIDNGYPPSTVYDAANGRRAGVKATAIVRKLEAFVHGRS